MPSTTQLVLLSVLSCSQILAQPRTFAQPPAAKDVTITAIPGVIEAGAKWTLVWQGNENADGIVGFKDGLLFAQEQTNTVNMLDKHDKFSLYLSNGHGPGAVAINPKGHVLVVERTCTDPGGHMGSKPADCNEPTGIAALTPTRKVLADSFMGKGLGRVNDLVADKKGGVYFTSGGAFYLSPTGQLISVGENLRTNGINLSPDEKTLYITNGPVIMAFDVQPDGSVKNQREFGKLEGGGNGDGMAIDATGRVYRHRQRHSSVQPRGEISGHDSDPPHRHQRSVLRPRQEDPVRRLPGCAGCQRPGDQNAGWRTEHRDEHL